MKNLNLLCTRFWKLYHGCILRKSVTGNKQLLSILVGCFTKSCIVIWMGRMVRNRAPSYGSYCSNSVWINPAFYWTWMKSSGSKNSPKWKKHYSLAGMQTPLCHTAHLLNFTNYLRGKLRREKSSVWELRFLLFLTLRS